MTGLKIGNTPLKRLYNIEKKYGTVAEIYAKIEGHNAGGSVKDRVALSIIEDAEKSGKLKKGGVVIEATSGNTGIGLALVCRAKGYKAVIVMPETMTIERRELIASYGAEIVLTDGKQGMAGAVKKAEELVSSVKGGMLAGQFDNPSNPKAHYTSTGVEIYQQTGGGLDAFVAGIGTGGTITGVGKYLKEKNPDVKIIGVEPARSPLLSKGYSGAHGLQGIGANFIPSILDTTLIDEIITAEEGESVEMMKILKAEEDIFAGISSGSALVCAIRVAMRPEMKNKKIVVLLPDDGNRYLSLL